MPRHTYILSHLTAAIRKGDFPIKKRLLLWCGKGPGHCPSTRLWNDDHCVCAIQEEDVSTRTTMGPMKINQDKREGWVLLNDDHTRGEEHKVYSSSGSHLLQPFSQDVEWLRRWRVFISNGVGRAFQQDHWLSPVFCQLPLLIRKHQVTFCKSP